MRDEKAFFYIQQLFGWKRKKNVFYFKEILLNNQNSEKVLFGETSVDDRQRVRERKDDKV